MNKFDPMSHNMTDEQRARLKELFPEAFTEQGIDFDRLKTLLGEVVETSPERYSFTWPGKTEAIRAAQASSMGTLAPDKNSSVDWDTTENLYLEGDNLEILKLLQKSYTGKVKMIYIDPPYNTGKDFVYPDKYGEGLKTYLEYTGQIDGEGKKLTTNTETDGRYHSKWLNMMYPRLMLARNLLKDDGVIFISIDDHEVHNLRKIMDEVFGAENLIGQLIHQRAKGGGQAKQIVKGHDYILSYAKKIDSGIVLKREKVVQVSVVTIEGKEYLRNDDVVRKTFGKYDKSLGDRRCFYDELEKYKGPEKKLEIDKQIREGKYVLENNKEGRPVIVEYTPIDEASSKLYSIIKVLSEEGKNDLDELGIKGFDYPKPVELIKQLIVSCTLDAKDDAIICDFFSGSGTTAQALMELNVNDGGNRRYIVSQIQEPLDASDKDQKTGAEFCRSISKPQNISEIGKERIRRAGIKIRKECAEKIAARETVLDTGFKTYRLAPSTFNVWDVKSSDDLQLKLTEAESLVRFDAAEDDVLTELILKSGYGLTERVEELILSGKKFYSVADGQLMISLESGLTLDHVREIAERKPAQFVAREHGFATDDVLTNTAQIMKDRGIDFRVL